MKKTTFLILIIGIILLFGGCAGNVIKVINIEDDKELTIPSAKDLTVRTLTLSSCGETIKNSKNNLAHVRQLFVGFNHFQFIDIPYSGAKIDTANRTVSAVKAKLDDSSIAAIIISERTEKCLNEKIFWISPYSKKLFRKKVIQKLIS